MSSRIQQLHERLQKHEIDLQKLNALENDVNSYKKQFEHIIEVQKKIGLNPKDGLYGSLRDSVHNLEALLKKDSSHDLSAQMLMLRRAEKDFMLRRNLKYIDKFNNSYSKFLHVMARTKLSEPEKSLAFLKAYKKDFFNLVEGYKEIGLNENDGDLGTLRNTIHKTELRQVSLIMLLKQVTKQFMILTIREV